MGQNGGLKNRKYPPFCMFQNKQTPPVFIHRNYYKQNQLQCLLTACNKVVKQHASEGPGMYWSLPRVHPWCLQPTFPSSARIPCPYHILDRTSVKISCFHSWPLTSWAGMGFHFTFVKQNISSVQIFQKSTERRIFTIYPKHCSAHHKCIVRGSLADLKVSLSTAHLNVEKVSFISASCQRSLVSASCSGPHCDVISTSFFFTLTSHQFASWCAVRKRVCMFQARLSSYSTTSPWVTTHFWTLNA